MHGGRQFVVAVNDHKQLDQWVHWLKFCIERILFNEENPLGEVELNSASDMRSRLASIAESRTIQKRSSLSSVDSAAPPGPANPKEIWLKHPNQSRLRVLVVQARTLPSSRDGTCHPYCSISLREDGTTVFEDVTDMRFSEHAPTWEEGFAIPITAVQCIAGKIVFEVWSQDASGSDDIVGSVSLDVEDIEPLPPVDADDGSPSADELWHPPSDTPSSKWYQLTGGAGELQLMIWLCLTETDTGKRQHQIACNQMTPTDLELRTPAPAFESEAENSPTEGANADDQSALNLPPPPPFEEDADTPTSNNDNTNQRDRMNSSLSSLVDDQEQMLAVASVRTLLTWQLSQARDMGGQLAAEDIEQTLQFYNRVYVPRQKQLQLQQSSQNDLPSSPNTPTPAATQDSNSPVPPLTLSPTGGKPDRFFYKDLKGRLQGPFTAEQMLIWHERKFFKPSLEVRVGDDGPFYRFKDVISHLMHKERLEWARSKLCSSEHPRANIRRWEFDAFQLKTSHVISMVALAFDELQIAQCFNINPRTFFTFVLQIRDQMMAHSAPFHNLYHTANVFQALFVMLTTFGASKYLSHLEVFACLTAALVMDLSHPGMDNKFMVSTSSPIASRFNDQSVLENFHISKAMDLLQSKGSNIFEGLTPAQFKEARSIIIDIVLATNPQMHQQLYYMLRQKLPGFLAANKQEKPAQHPAQTCHVSLPPPERNLLMRVLLRSADLSYTARNWEQSKVWGKRAEAELLRQGDKEAELGLEVPPSRERRNRIPLENDLNFCEFVAIPLFCTVRKVLPKFQPCIENLRLNRKEYIEVISDYEKNRRPTDRRSVLADRELWSRREAKANEQLDEKPDVVP